MPRKHGDNGFHINSPRLHIGFDESVEEVAMMLRRICRMTHTSKDINQIFENIGGFGITETF